ncbi:uncharacterized protein LOC129789187 [Lutzomyia longipalpis]|uniref:uncharacterized protein LOC129789187 n=1 Tax=Lutzomyia longipalpis TaxID=7200 RepID=UPI0024844656|nr:uncharacterized protein LOC129789187 [Lutzomyia longipalpis]
MRVVGLISGGKDSIFNLMQCKAEGHEIVALANLYPNDDREEMDSWMYQTVGHSGIEMIATALDLPLYRRKTSGVCQQNRQDYTPEDPADEVEDLYHLLHEVKMVEKVDAVASGAILSDYQRCRVENVCARLQLTSLSYLWRRNQTKLLQEMIDCGMEAIVIKVAALGLTPERHLGKTLREIQGDVMKLNKEFGVNVCGEGGEYETFTLDCPLFKYRIVVADRKIVSSADDVGYIVFEKLNLEKKSPEEVKVLISPEASYKGFEYGDFSVSEVIQKVGEDFEYPHRSRIPSDRPTEWIWLPAIQGNGQDCEEGAKNAMEQLKKSTEDCKIQLTDIISINIFVRSMKDFAKINAVYSSYLNFQNPPSRACVETKLPENVWVVLEALAGIPHPDTPKDCVHVQGISHWAPSNIGPYSQGKKLGRITIISGQIGLIAGKMSLPPNGDFSTECKLSLRNADCVIRALDSAQGLQNVSYAICYLPESRLIPKAAEMWDSLSCDAIVTYVVVSCLPRNAQIEWQVLLHSPENPSTLNKITYSTETFELNLQKLSNSSDNFKIVSGMILNRNDASGQDSSLDHFGELLERMWKNFSSGKVSKSTHCRVFYKVTEEQRIQSKLLSFLEELKINFVVVPVVDLEDEAIASITFINLD